MTELRYENQNMKDLDALLVVCGDSQLPQSVLHGLTCFNSLHVCNALIAAW